MCLYTGEKSQKHQNDDFYVNTSTIKTLNDYLSRVMNIKTKKEFFIFRK